MKRLLNSKCFLAIVAVAIILLALSNMPVPNRQDTRASVSLVLDQPVDVVWNIVSDLRQSANYVPGVERVEIQGAQSEGVGARRRVYKTDGPWLDETVSQWREGEGISLRLHHGELAPFPFIEASFDYRLQPLSASATAVHLSLGYRPRYGVLGALLNSWFVTARVEQEVMAVGLGLKRYSERGTEDSGNHGRN